MNVHHLELFYYVARHGGISSAVRHMPYGIQQPAVSSQISQLEKDLGVKLFQRQPFVLTPAGNTLREFVDPFFDNLHGMAQRLRVDASAQLRVGASEIVLRTHLPVVLERLRHHHPRVRLALRSGFDTQLAAWLRDGETDLLITPLAGKPPPRVRCVPLLKLPLVLLVPKKWRLRSIDELWKTKRPTQPLISMPARESVSVLFQRGLRKRGVEWPVSIEASSLGLITQYVADGRGAGASLQLPEVAHPRVQALPLEGFDLLNVAVLWHGEPSPLIRALVEEGQRYVRELWPDARNSISTTASSEAAPTVPARS